MAPHDKFEKKIDKIGGKDFNAAAMGGVSGVNEFSAAPAGGAKSINGFMSLFTTIREQEAKKPEVIQATQISKINGDIKENTTQIADLQERIKNFSEDSNEYKIIKDIIGGLERRGEELNKQLTSVNPYADLTADNETARPTSKLNFEC